MAMRLEFDWDPEKAQSNITKHDIAFEDAMSVFTDPLAMSRLDVYTSATEERWITVGLGGQSNLLLVVHTYIEVSSDHTYIRIISARKPTKNERRQYEQESN
jgi:uncharacterized protein